MNLKKHIYKSIIMIILFLTLSNVAMITNADSLNSFITDSSTGWTKNGLDIHMGQKESTYKFSSNAVESDYSVYVTNGIALWGSYISCTKGNSSAPGTIKTSSMDSSANAETTHTYNSSTYHIST